MSDESRISSKAKGKQRAYPMSKVTKLGQEMSSRAESKQDLPRIELAIRFVDGSPDMLLEMSPEDTGASVLTAMRDRRLELADKHLRLIHSGRMLAAHTPLNMLRSTGSMRSKEVEEEKHQGLGRLSLSLPSRWSQDTTRGKAAPDEDEDSPLQNRVWLHCAATQAETDHNEGEEPGGFDLSDAGTPQAYDRLMDAGLSTADVQSIRALFRRVMYGSSANTSSGVGVAHASSSSWTPTTTEAHQLESQWLDSITQPSIFEEPHSSQTDSASTSGTIIPSLLSYLLPTTNHGSPARATTQGLIFAFFFPFIAGSAVASEVLLRPPAFFDGEIWPELNREAVEMYAALEEETRDGANIDGATMSSGDAAREGENPEESLEEVAELLDPADVDNRQAVSRARPRVFDMAMDSSPCLIFSPGMQSAIRAGLILNVVTGFYLWLYAS